MTRARRWSALCAVVSVALVLGCAPVSEDPSVAALDPGQATPMAGAIRLSGTVEAARSRTVAVPRLRGVSSLMVITSLVPPGSRVEPGDLLVEFDRQEQERLAFDAEAQVVDLDSQIARRRADQGAAEAKDQTELVAARNDVARAELAVRANDLIARIEAEKNTLALEQAEAKLAQLEITYALKRTAAAADLRILEIRRDRAASALAHAVGNASLMEIRAPFAGLVVIKTLRRSGSQTAAPILEGDEVRAGQGVVDIVDTSAMLVRARVNQADAHAVYLGQPAIVRLDGFPDLVFDGRVEQLTPLATTSSMSPHVRSMMAVVSIDGIDEQLLPDLTASVELQPVAATEGVQR